LTIAHYNIIANALKQFDGVVINLVKAKVDERNPFPVELQIKMLQACFGDSIDIMTSSTGNIVTILNKSDKVISTVLAGTDRVQNYRDQLVKSEEIKVQEIPRVDEVSGTKVRNAIKNGDIETFQTNTPKQVWPFFNELKKYIR
jgi:nicotinamide mononucleotide adenylyltransferase